MRNAPRGAVVKPKDFWGTLKRLLKYMSLKKWLLLFAFLLSGTATILQIFTPKVLGSATTVIFEGVMKGSQEGADGIARFPIDFDTIKSILILLFGLYIANAVLGYIAQFTLVRIVQKTVYDLRQDFKKKMSRVPISYYDSNSNGDIMSRAINDVDNIARQLVQIVNQAIISVVQFFGILILMLTISWKLSLVALITVPLSAFIISRIAPKSQKYFGKQQRELGKLNGQIEENFSGHTEIIAFNQEEKSIEIFEEQNEKLFKVSFKAQFVSGVLMPLMNMVKNLGYVFVAVLGGLEVANGAMSLGNVQAFLTYTNQFSEPMKQLTNILNTIQSIIASTERIFEVLDEEEMPNTKTNKPKVETDEKLTFEHVRFGYGDSADLMTDFNLSVKAGQMIAIVGPTGAGKSTIINLLERFYDIRGGSIRLDGTDTRDIDRDELRNHFAMVLQDTWLFHGTIFDNIKYGAREGVSDEEVYAAAKMAHADEFIRTLPDGYQTYLNEDASNISQGQRQLLTIARAFIRDPEILILDEATSSVDTRTEILIQQAMRKLLEGRTSFVVAHRLSTIRDADNIIVMNQGDIMETGNHNELMAQGGFYADLYNSQFNEAS
ncbi:multidrug ABC transporter ATP-binding protein [Jeotgalibaca sp. PTS2502]|uniref:ABC transporter ATP-binding protein n=1 Tax=Jeotgalibaca sp. PTS2502 TaxID=1903686 RepID=UPI000973AB47|nr:ABC transporter ATP-binding protein [Jeotgalibaca sp. PTS2502]APZ48530.1 multidrug ABC transporter ATP-binding protein [Jeotgalibaca sp. PTS2502]